MLLIMDMLNSPNLLFQLLTVVARLPWVHVEFQVLRPPFLTFCCTHLKQSLELVYILLRQFLV